ncbi:vomeronasal type-2 receptor 26-like [Bufo gargarizans]|uniref:vomeronasal type-2 receptor 26-like n=1 Tax=Bufo gargarizans TaxID=30331 RepID=UPI001CF200ED|nr:vomeronasal type-2 receptor 26-like [Bufo gargarizans]
MDNSGMNYVIPLKFILEQTLTFMQQGIMIEEEQLMNLAVCPIIVGDTQRKSAMKEEDKKLPLEEEEEESEERKYDEEDGTSPDTPSSQCGAEPGRTGSSGTQARMVTCCRSSSSSQFILLNIMEQFFHVPRQAEAIQQADSSHLHAQFFAYLNFGQSLVHTPFPGPMDFWASRLEQKASRLTPRRRCFAKIPSLHLVRHLLVFMFAIEEINRRSDLLPNITLGYKIFDSCVLEHKAVQSALSILSGRKEAVPNYSCDEKNKVVAFIGHLTSSSSLSIAEITGIYGYPQISYGAMDPVFSNKLLFPYFYRTVPDGSTQYEATVLLLKHFGWSWVGMVTADDESSQRASMELYNVITRSGLCIAYRESVKDLPSFIQSMAYKKVFYKIQKTYCNVIIFVGNSYGLLSLDSLLSDDFNPRKVIIMLSLIFPDKLIMLTALQGSLQLTLQKGRIQGLKEYLLTAGPLKNSGLEIMFDEWEYLNFNCTLSNDYSYYRPCDERDVLGNVDRSLYDVDNFRYTFSVYSAVYIVAYALHHLIYSHKGQEHLQLFNIQHLQDAWKTPRSACSESCLPGHRKVPLEEKQKCCYYCAPCAEGEISNQTDMETCLECPKDYWSNGKRDSCVPRPIEFLSYLDMLGSSLIIINLTFCLVTIFVLWMFNKKKDSPIVKANNQNLSFILLFSLILSFLCPLLFIGRPSEMSCLLRQMAFGIIFSLAVSSVLAKTVTVVLAFRAIKPGRTMRQWLGRHLSTSILITGTIGEVVICVFWLSFSPPFPDHNTEIEIGKIILQCNEGSAIAFYLAIGYIGFLAMMSFIVAFLARKLPDTFNEAQYITFSMVVFCSVWISFIPAYLSTKGKYMVAVEIFAITSSSAGLLGCIFIPKCYIILLRPELNIKSSLYFGQAKQ